MKMYIVLLLQDLDCAFVLKVKQFFNVQIRCFILLNGSFYTIYLMHPFKLALYLSIVF